MHREALQVVVDLCRKILHAVVQYVLQKMYIIRPDKRKLVILDSISGVLKPGRLTLLLGPPSSGKSTLLKALSGALMHTGLQVSIKFFNLSFKLFFNPAS
jgi:ABC-type multidrug transport system ATPase subunit